MKKVIASVVALLSLVSLLAAEPTYNVSVAWTANTEADLAGYNLYWLGGTNGTFAKRQTVGKVTSLLATNLPVGATNYFYLTAFNTAGLESDPSAVVHHLLAKPLPVLSITLGTNITINLNLN